MPSSKPTNPHRPTTHATPAHPLGPLSFSGIRKARSRPHPHARKSHPPSTTEPTQQDTNTKPNAHQPSVKDITTAMARLTVSDPPNELPKPPNKPRPRARSEPPPAPPADFPAPPTKLLEGLRVGVAELERRKRVVLNCRYRVPNTSLTAYHRRGRVMLCRP